MELPQINKSNIEDHLNREEIILATIQQIMKDFGMFGLEINFSGDIQQAYSEIHQQLTHQVEDLFQVNLSKLYAVLYQVDISNNALEKAQKEMTEFSLIEVIAHKIIERELQKVLMRRYFSSI